MGKMIVSAVWHWELPAAASHLCTDTLFAVRGQAREAQEGHQAQELAAPYGVAGLLLCQGPCVSSPFPGQVFLSLPSPGARGGQQYAGLSPRHGDRATLETR